MLECFYQGVLPRSMTTGWRRLMLRASLAAGLCATTAFAGTPGGPDHAVFTQVLRDHVKHSGVDYKAIKADARFPRYIALLQQTNPASIIDRNDLLAFWLNAYNAFTIQYVIEHYPLKSLMDKSTHGSSNAFDADFIEINGVTYSLNDIENGIIRPMGEARIHFALVCGARSCPPLRPEAYCGDRLGDQLDEQGRIFLNQSDKNRFNLDENEIHLSKIFDWFRDDFRKEGQTEIDFISRFLPDETAQKLLQNAATVKITYMEYDWSLNE